MIRRAVPNDIDAINTLGSLVNENFTKVFDVSKILEEKFSKIFVYEKDNKVVGFLHITELYENADVINIVVDTDYRRQQIALNLMGYMQSDLARGVTLITLEVNVNNTAAIKLYEKLGFDIVNVRKNYYGEDNAYLMAKGM